jgi:hypothetical protein
MKKEAPLRHDNPRLVALLAAAALIVLSLASPDSARASEADQQDRSLLTLNVEAGPSPDEPLCPGEAATVIVTVAATYTQPGQSRDEALQSAVVAPEILPLVIAGDAVTVRQRPADYGEYDLSFEVRAVKPGNAAVMFTHVPASSFTLVRYQKAPLAVTTPSPISARPATLHFEVSECSLTVYGSQYGYTSGPWLVGHTIGSIKEVRLTPDNTGRYTGTTELSLNWGGVVIGPYAECMWSVSGLTFPVTIDARLANGHTGHPMIRLTLSFGPGQGSVPVQCSHAGTAEGDMLQASMWNTTVLIPVEGDHFYHIDDFPGTQGAVDSLNLVAKLNDE